MMGTSSLFCLSAGNKHQRRDNNKNSITPVPVSHWFLIISLSVLSVCLSSHHHIKTLLTHYTVFDKQPAGRHYCVYKQQQANTLLNLIHHILYSCLSIFFFKTNSSTDVSYRSEMDNMRWWTESLCRHEQNHTDSNNLNLLNYNIWAAGKSFFHPGRFYWAEVSVKCIICLANNSKAHETHVWLNVFCLYLWLTSDL